MYFEYRSDMVWFNSFHCGGNLLLLYNSIWPFILRKCSTLSLLLLLFFIIMRAPLFFFLFVLFFVSLFFWLLLVFGCSSARYGRWWIGHDHYSGQFKLGWVRCIPVWLTNAPWFSLLYCSNVTLCVPVSFCTIVFFLAISYYKCRQHQTWI